MEQQINFYRSEFKKKERNLSSASLLITCGVFVALMVAAYGYATFQFTALERELKVQVDGIGVFVVFRHVVTEHPASYLDEGDTLKPRLRPRYARADQQGSNDRARETGSRK